jgi:hypothetical protein
LKKRTKKPTQRQEILEDTSPRMNRPQQESETVTRDLCRWSRGTQKNEKRGGGNETGLGSGVMSREKIQLQLWAERWTDDPNQETAALKPGEAELSRGKRKLGHAAESTPHAGENLRGTRA